MLDARQLEAFSAVVEHGGFGPAAQALSLTLPAVSVRIKALEDGMGQRLLVRGKRVRATAAGQALLAHVKQVQMMEADVLAGLQAGASVGSGAAAWQSLSVAINADSVASWFCLVWRPCCSATGSCSISSSTTKILCGICTPNLND